MAQAMPPLIPDEALIGEWRLTAGASVGCSVFLRLDTPTQKRPVIADAGCLSSMGLEGARQWRGSSDGLGVAAGDGRTLAFFSHQPDGSYLWHDARRDRSIRLVRR